MKTLIALAVMTFGLAVGTAFAAEADVMAAADQAVSERVNFGRWNDDFTGSVVSQRELLSLVGQARMDELSKECGSALSLTAKTRAGALALIYLQKRTELAAAEAAKSRARREVVLGQIALGMSEGALPPASLEPSQHELDRSQAGVDALKTEVSGLESALMKLGLLDKASGVPAVKEGTDFQMHLYGHA